MEKNAASTVLLIVLALVTPATARGQGELAGGTAGEVGRPVLAERLLGSVLRIEPSFSYRQAVLRVAGPGRYALTRRFAAAEPLEVDLLAEAEPIQPVAPAAGASAAEDRLRNALPDGRYVYEAVFLAADGGRRTHVGRFAVENGTLSRRPSEAPRSGSAELAAAPTEGPPPEAVTAAAVTEADFIKIDDGSGDGTTFLTLDSDDGAGGALETWGLFNRFGDFTVEECGDGSNLGLCQNVLFTLLQDQPSPRVGIGTAAPSSALHVVGGNGIRLTSGSADFSLRTISAFSELRIENPANGHVFVTMNAGAGSSLVFADDGIGIGTHFPQAELHVDGSGIIEGDVALGSSRSIKHGIEPLDVTEVLTAVRDLPLYSWSYETDPLETRHVGPMAEDVYAAFRLGRDEKHLSPADSAGLALAAVQGLDAELRGLRQHSRELVERNRRLVQRVEALERLLTNALPAAADPWAGARVPISPAACAPGPSSVAHPEEHVDDLPAVGGSHQMEIVDVFR